MIYVLVTLDGSLVKFGFTADDDLHRAVTQTSGFPCRFYCAFDGSKTHEKRTHRTLHALGLGVPGDNGKLLEEWFRLDGEALDYVNWLGQQPFVATSVDEAAHVWAHPGMYVWEDWRSSLNPVDVDDQLSLDIPVGEWFVPRVRVPRRHADDQGWHASISDEWYTPREYVEAVREVMGGIDLDPASCAAANKVVQAAAIYTREVNGLHLPWRERVYLNPPYGDEGPLFVRKLLDEISAGRTVEAIVCLNANSQESRWFQPLWDHTLCFVRGRVHFYSPSDERPASPNKGTVFVYIGPNAGRFCEVFSRFGNVVRRVDVPAMAVSA